MRCSIPGEAVVVDQVGRTSADCLRVSSREELVVVDNFGETSKNGLELVFRGGCAIVVGIV
jgi:hypothetical protein